MEQKNANDLQTWDLSCRSKQETNSESEKESEFFDNSALDLSCKKPVNSPATTKGLNTAAYFSHLPAYMDMQHQPLSLSDADKQSPFASTVMLSPPSENSLKIEKREPFLYNIGSEITNSTPLFVPPPGVTMGVPFLRPLLPMPLHLNNRAIKIPVATSTTASTSTSYAKTSLQTNEAIEKTLVDFPTESSTQVEMSTPSLDLMKKIPRPFKAYSNGKIPTLKRPMDPMFSSNYLEFREKIVQSFKKMRESAPNPKMRRTSKSPGLPTSTADEKDFAYWEKRRKNNEAAKRSRDNRRAKEDELAIWASFLQQENTHLKSEIRSLYCLLQQTGYDINQIKKYNFGIFQMCANNSNDLT